MDTGESRSCHYILKMVLKVCSPSVVPSWLTRCAQDLSCLLSALIFSSKPQLHPQKCVHFAELKRTASLMTSQTADSSDMTDPDRGIIPPGNLAALLSRGNTAKSSFPL